MTNIPVTLVERRSLLLCLALHKAIGRQQRETDGAGSVLFLPDEEWAKVVAEYEEGRGE